MRFLSASSRLRNKKRIQNLCIHSGCWHKAALNRARCASHIKLHRKESNRDNFDIKRKVLSYYGKVGKLKCCWKLCSVGNIHMLTIDHISDDGYKERKLNRHIAGVRLYRILRKAKFPKGYQTLCANHQLLKEFTRRRRNWK